MLSSTLDPLDKKESKTTSCQKTLCVNASSRLLCLLLEKELRVDDTLFQTYSKSLLATSVSKICLKKIIKAILKPLNLKPN
jgi:hypothetical protein